MICIMYVCTYKKVVKFTFYDTFLKIFRESNVLTASRFETNSTKFQTTTGFWYLYMACRSKLKAFLVVRVI